jgi:hypothetical protein
MQITVGPAPTRLVLPSDATPVFQNLGPAAVYIDTDADLTVGSGFRLPVGAGYEFTRDLSFSGGSVWLVADAPAADVRYMIVG